MFPNVLSVISDNASFETRDMLIEDNRLLNSFYKRNDDVLDMKGINSIWPNALNGCMTKKVINTDDLELIYEKSFCGYEPSIDPKTGTKLFGDVIVELNDETENIECILKANSESFLVDQIRNKQEEAVIRLVKTGIVQPNVLKMALKMTEDNNMTTASAYILNALKDQTDKTNFDI